MVVSASGRLRRWGSVEMMAWYYRALGLGMMVFVQRDRWCLLLVLPCWVEGQWEIPLVGLEIGGEPEGPGGLGEID